MRPAVRRANTCTVILAARSTPGSACSTCARTALAARTCTARNRSPPYGTPPADTTAWAVRQTARRPPTGHRLGPFPLRSSGTPGSRPTPGRSATAASAASAVATTRDDPKALGPPSQKPQRGKTVNEVVPAQRTPPSEPSSHAKTNRIQRTSIKGRIRASERRDQTHARRSERVNKRKLYRNGLTTSF